MSRDNCGIKDINAFLVREIGKALECGRVDSFTYLLEQNLASPEFAEYIDSELVEQCYRYALERQSFNDGSRIFFAASKAGILTESLLQNVDVQIVRSREDDEVPTVGILYDHEEERVFISWRERGGAWSNSKTLTPGDLSVFWGTHADEGRREVALPAVKEIFQNMVDDESKPEWERSLAAIALDKLAVS